MVHAMVHAAMLSRLAAPLACRWTARCSSLLRRVVVSLPAARSFSQVDGEFARDTLLYRHNNLGKLRALQFFAFVNLALWAYLGSFLLSHVGALSESQEALVSNSETPNRRFWQRVSDAERKYHKYLTGLCLLIGYGSVAVIGFFSTRSINALVVRRGGSEVTILTSRFIAISRLRQLTVPLSHLSCRVARSDTASYMTIKVKGYPFFFLIDNKGTFYKPFLFDRVIGVHRNLNRE